MRSNKRPLRIFGAIFVIFIMGLTAAGFASSEVAWRFTVLEEKLSGKIPEIPFLTLIRWMRPGSAVYLRDLAELPNVNASINSFHSDRKSAEAGARVYGRVCTECHGDNARGRTGPDLVAALASMSDWSFFSTVKWGRPRTIMVAQPLSDLEIWQVHAFIRQTTIEMAVGRHSPEAMLPAFQPVTFDMLREADRTGEWLTYSGNYAGFRHGMQNQISRRNVRELRLTWAAQLPGEGMPLESTPVVVGDRLFVTQSPEGVTALDTKTGAVIWAFHRPVPTDIPLCCGAQNRGVAILGDTIFVETLDAHLIALDAATGAKRWDARVADWRDGYSMTGAPLAVEDCIVVGVGGGDLGIRGFLAAYAAKDGSPKWRFDTVPGPGQPGNETWGNDSWKRGGAATWTTGAYDPTLNLIYWGTGNPVPAYFSGTRPGINLYANSLIAVDARTGQLRWYFQFTPSDTHDWDATQQPVLADIPWHGQTRPVLLLANRNGFFYVLDRQTGRFLQAEPFAKQTWASGFTADGRPIVRPGSEPSRSGSLVWPTANGATNWWPPSFDPKRNLLFVPSVDSAAIYFHDQTPRFHHGESFGGSSYDRAANQSTSVAIRAIDATTGDKRWEALLATGGVEVRGEMSGVLSTEGHLVFVGYAGEFLALDSDTGKTLWTTPLGADIHAPPITYTVAGQQYVAVFAGRTLFTFGLPPKDESIDVHVAAVKTKSTDH
ncbi:MAG: PQQ-binding-like beta-propeller repeat protein [Acidobacteriia bacterium]|nr:PQQ-binding-like beta-propeller repeat protein [Terriglobia bacterium]